MIRNCSKRTTSSSIFFVVMLTEDSPYFLLTMRLVDLPEDILVHILVLCHNCGLVELIRFNRRLHTLIKNNRS